MSKFKIVLTGHGRGRVYIDGDEMMGVTGLSFNAGVDSLNRLSISVLADEIEIEGEADVTTRPPPPPPPPPPRSIRGNVPPPAPPRDVRPFIA